MNTRSINRPLYSLDVDHAVRRFLDAFAACRKECVGREIEYPGRSAIDQKWVSKVDGKEWTFSAFAYQVLSFDVELDGWLTAAPSFTESEQHTLAYLPKFRQLLRECESQALVDRNADIQPLIAQALEMFDLWENCLRSRMKEAHFAGQS